MDALTTSVRDKLVITALILFGLCAFITVWIDRSTAGAMIGLVSSIITGLAAFYKGNPTMQTPTSSQTDQTVTTKTSETVSDKGVKDATQT